MKHCGNHNGPQALFSTHIRIPFPEKEVDERCAFEDACVKVGRGVGDAAVAFLLPGDEKATNLPHALAVLHSQSAFDSCSRVEKEGHWTTTRG